MDSLTLLYDCKTKVLQRFFIAKNNKRKHRFLHVPQKNREFIKKEQYSQEKNKIINSKYSSKVIFDRKLVNARETKFMEDWGFMFKTAAISL